MFDYTFYRTAKRHFKRDGSDSSTAILTITFIVCLYCIPLYDFIIVNILGFNLSSLNNKIILILIALIVFFITKKRYKGKYFIFREKWINETKTEKLLGVLLIVIFFFLPLLFMFIIKYFLNNKII